MVGVESIGEAEEMPGRWHEIIGSGEQIAGFGEVVIIRGVAGERVHRHDLDVGRVLARGAFEHCPQTGLGGGVPVLSVHRTVKARREGGPVAAARRVEPMVGCPNRAYSCVAVAVASQDTTKVNTSEREETQLSCRPPDLDDSFEGLDRFVDLASLLENPAERVEVRRLGGGVAEASGGGGSSAQVGGGVVVPLFGLCDVSEEGVEVVECPVVAEWPQETVRFDAGSACCNDVAVKERGVGGQDPGAAEVPPMGFVEQRPALVEHRRCPVETATILDQHERQGRATERRQVRVTGRVGGDDSFFGGAGGPLDVAGHFEPGDVRQWTHPVRGV